MLEKQTLVSANSNSSARRVERISLLGLIARRFLAWRTRHVATAELTILEARRRVAEACRVTEEAEAELEMGQFLRAIPGEQGVQILGVQAEMERLQLERERLRRQRLQQGLPTTGATLAALPPAVEWEISDQEIEALAVKAVTHFGALESSEAERAWLTWRRELELRLPPYAAAEVARRAEQLRPLAR
jgi:hypothetical protein